MSAPHTVAELMQWINEHFQCIDPRVFSEEELHGFGLITVKGEPIQKTTEYKHLYRHFWSPVCPEAERFLVWMCYEQVRHWHAFYPEGWRPKLYWRNKPAVEKADREFADEAPDMLVMYIRCSLEPVPEVVEAA